MLVLLYGWLIHIGGHCIYNLVLIYLCANVGTTTVYTVMNLWAAIKCGEFLNYLRSY